MTLICIYMFFFFKLCPDPPPLVFDSSRVCGLLPFFPPLIMPLTAIYTSRGSPCFGLDGKSQGLRRRVSNVTTKRLHSRPWTRTQLSHICRASNSDEDSSPLTVESIQKENEELLPRSKLPQQRRAEANGLLFSSIVQHPWEAMYARTSTFTLVSLLVVMMVVVACSLQTCLSFILLFCLFS